MLSVISVQGIFLHHLPGGQSRPLQDRPGLIDIDMESFACLAGRTDHAEGRPVTGRGERTGVAVGEDPGVVGDQVSAVRTETAVPVMSSSQIRTASATRVSRIIRRGHPFFQPQSIQDLYR